MLRLEADNLKAPNIAHGFFGRSGGVSSGVYATLNCSFNRLAPEKDEQNAVAENRRRIGASLGCETVVTVSQVHGNEAHIVSQPWVCSEDPHADAMATSVAGIALGILTADCVPVLLADPHAHVIAAAHAGWKGALSGVTDSAIAAMERLGATLPAIRAAIGPCISQKNYEVGNDFRDRFLQADLANTRFFAPGRDSQHCQFDLAAYVTHRLKAAGIGDVEPVIGCTYAQDGDFFSFRRATHRGEKDYGREISAIMLR